MRTNLWTGLLLLGSLMAAGVARAGEGDAPAEEPAPDSDSGESGEGGDSEGEGDEDEGEAEGPPPPIVPGGPQIDLSNAAEAPALTSAQHDFLKPRRSELPQYPYAQTDFTAYSLEFGEFKVGLASITAGVLPRVQLGTTPSLWLLGIPNLNGKFNALRLGPLDLAVTASGGQLNVGDGFHVRKMEAGVFGSLILPRTEERWSVHGGASVGNISMLGEPDLSQLSFLLEPIAKVDELVGNGQVSVTLDGYYDYLLDQLNSNEVSFDLNSRTLSGRIATDYRFNRRDSLILQGSAVLARDVSWGYTVTTDGVEKRYDEPLDSDLLPTLFGIQEFFTEGERPLAATYNVSASWQWAWRHVDLRLGLGWSAIQPQWLLQAVELDYRFGGKTRTEERKIRKGWRKDRKNIDNPDLAQPGE